MTLAILSWTLLAFAVVKILFATLGWLLQPEDPIFRRHLDAMWDRLHEVTLVQAVIGILSVIHRRLSSTFAKESAFRLFFIACFFLNYISALVGLGIIGSMNKFGFWYSLSFINRGGHIGLLFLSAVLAYIDVVSLRITIALLGHIKGRSHSGVVVFHMVLEMTIITSAFLIAMAQFHFVMFPSHYHFSAWPGSAVWGVLSRIPELIVRLPHQPLEYFILMVVFTATAAFPNLLYCIALLVLLLIWPRWLWLTVRRLIYCVTTDKSPVLAQLGTASASIAALLTALASLLKSMT